MYQGGGIWWGQLFIYWRRREEIGEELWEGIECKVNKKKNYFFRYWESIIFYNFRCKKFVWFRKVVWQILYVIKLFRYQNNKLDVLK